MISLSLSRWLPVCLMGTALLYPLFSPAKARAADKLVLVAGTGTQPPGNPAKSVKLDGPFAIDFHLNGSAYVVEIAGHRVLGIDHATGVMSLIGGTGAKGNGGDGGPAADAQFNSMHSLAAGNDNALYIADTLNNRVRKIDLKTRQISAFAGTGKKGDQEADGPAAKADIGAIYCVAFDSARENLYLTDLDDRRIRKVNLKTGVLTNVAGNGKKGVPEDGADARTSPLVDPRAAVVDAAGNLYILERSGHALRVVDAQGKIRTVAGTGKAGLSGDGGDAKQATLNGPKHLCIDQDGSVLIADTENHVIRRYTPSDGKISRVAGTGKKGTAGLEGSPLEAELAQPHGVTVHRDGTLYIVDSSNDRILKIEKTVQRKSVGRDANTGSARAVALENVPLLHTAQLFPRAKPDAAAAGDARSQIAEVWRQLVDLMPQRDTRRLVRVHLYAADDASLAAAQAFLKTQFAEIDGPALSVVVGKLAEPQALVALDAVAIGDTAGNQVTLQSAIPSLKCASFASMPRGARLYISGQAEKGDLPTATRLTLESLHKTLKQHGLDKQHIVQVKAFATPIAEAGVIRAEVDQFFAGRAPPLSLVEWSSSLPIEIEVVAWAGTERKGEPVEYLPALEFSNSPVYARVTRINHGGSIYISGLFGKSAKDGQAEVTEIFDELSGLLKETGSDMKHLVKATYYVSKVSDATQKLNELRPKYYDPKRPPAASKAEVAGTGRPDRGLTLDMIAVPTR